MAALTTSLPQRPACAAGARRQCGALACSDAAPVSRQWAFTDAVLSRVSASRRARCTAALSGSRALRAVATSTADASALPASLLKIVTSFQMVPDPMQRYKQLLFYASKLKVMPADLHTADNKVQGCVSQARKEKQGAASLLSCPWRHLGCFGSSHAARRSSCPQVWVHPELREDGRVYFQADSDSQLTKARQKRSRPCAELLSLSDALLLRLQGLAALLVEGLSGCLPEEVVRLTPDFIEQLGLKQSLTPSRNNGFLNMLRLMQKKTLVLAAATAASGAAAPQESQAVVGSTRPVYAAMVAKLTQALTPVELRIQDQSHQHAGHVSAKGLGRASETHFAVTVVSPACDGLSLVARHRLVYGALKAELDGGVHALTIDARTPQEAA